jgi:hypothetical protein
LGASTIYVILQIGGQIAISLLDTSSSNTFFDEAFTMKHNFALSPARNVKVIGGGEVILY